MGGRGGSKLVMLLSTPFPHLLLLRPRPPQLRLGRHLPTSLHHHPFTTSTPPLLPFPLTTTPLTNTSALFHTQAAHSSTVSDNHHQQQPQPLPAPTHPWPWPEWTSFLQLLSSRGYFDRFGVEGDAFAPLAGALPPQFMREATACLLFARDRPDLLRSLSRKDIEVVVENGTASLFINAMDSANRLRSFLAGSNFDVLEAERVGTLDLMRYLLTYAANHLLTSHEENFKSKDIVELSVCNLINGLVGLFRSSEGFSFSESFSTQPHEGHVQCPGSFRQGIEMKQGDWICPKCNFMNFARNIKCLDCKADRPPRNLTGREWECPQCNFLNYGRNIVCLRCDCQQPGDSLSGPAALSNSGFTKGSDTTLPLTRNIANQAEIERRLAANDEKAERWFSKMSQLDNDMSSAIADEDFPEIMPLRKGVNRFVVSTRKTPLERRLANAQYRKNLGNGGAPEAYGPQSPATSSSSSITENLDRILGRVTQPSEKDKSSLPHVNASFTKENSSGRDKVNTSVFDQNVGNQRRDDSYVPFVPFPKDMFSQNQSEVSKIEEKPKITEHFTSPKSIEPGNYDKMFLTENPEKATEEKSVEQGDKPERWHDNFSPVNDVSDLASTVSDNDFPEIMPMRKGENRFVVGKKKDRSLTSPQYKRRLAMEQANSSNYVPFVPFPPDYFAKKDKQPEAGDIASSKSLSSNISESEPLIQSLTPQKPGDNETVGSNWGGSHDKSVNYKNEEMNKQYQESGHVLKFGGDTGVSSARGSSPANVQYSNDQPSPQPSGNSVQYGKDSSDKRGFTGKSLEGSAVTEPDPLDMSEEAKAARWFRRVQQINDISELANIPDEDFPSIMPMRKGVNRFVVSKRKTPLERRLTSPKYRRDLPIFSSEPKQMSPPDSEGSN